MDIKTFRDLWWDDMVTSVLKKVDDSWRHGNYVYEVFVDEQGQYWSVTYQVTGDGEYNTLREAECHDPIRVYPHTKTITVTEYLDTPAA